MQQTCVRAWAFRFFISSSLSLSAFGQHLDSDGDLIPNVWEDAYGFNSFDPSDALEDEDGDFLNNQEEFIAGTNPHLFDSDNDFIPDRDDLDPLDPTRAYDSDQDGIDDHYEILYPPLNPDFPGDANIDFDGDSLTALEEYLAGTSINHPDTDNDGVIDGEDAFPTNSLYRFDTDLDGMPDAFEDARPYLDSNFAGDATLDFDFDELTNLEEFVLGTALDNDDTDYDLVGDSEDIAPNDRAYSYDSDLDGMPDEFEFKHYYLSAHRYDGYSDLDFDGLSNIREFKLGTDLNNFDSDGDGFNDFEDRYPLDSRYQLDIDSDGMPDNFEYQYGFDPTPEGEQDGREDLDGDGITNAQEFFLGTSPLENDSDFDLIPDNQDLWPTDGTKALDSDYDGISDAEEIIRGMDPFNGYDVLEDSDGDGLTLRQEIALGTSDEHLDSDSDGILDNEDPWPNNGEYSLDNDGDGLPNAYEERNDLDPNQPFDARYDFDSDGLSNLEEFLAGTNPGRLDSDMDGTHDNEDFAPLDPQYSFDEDRDGLPDEWERVHDLDPYNPFDAQLDNDIDQLTNIEEFHLGTDPNHFDSDNDGVADAFDHYPLDARYSDDRDRDGMPSFYEWHFGFSPDDTYDGGFDFDEDGLNNSQEFFAGTHPHNDDSDFDQVLDGNDLWPTDRTRALDSDNDGLSDAYEVINGLDPFFSGDARRDFDGDGLSLLQEIRQGTSDEQIDSDGDGAYDNDDPWPTHAEYRFDDDNDGLPNNYEEQYFFLDRHFGWDARQDYDYDNLTNLEEFVAKTDPENHDTDQDGRPDGFDAAPLDPRYSEDHDHDGMFDHWELAYGLNPNDPLDALMDADYDGLSNLNEFQQGTSPINHDTDGDYEFDGFDHFPLNPRYAYDSDRDGMPDSYEWDNQLDPHNTYDGAEDLDGDMLRNSQEFFAGTDPHNTDSDFDGVSDGEDLWPMDRTKALDNDSDGLSDAYEVINGMDPFNEFDGLIDQDGDGLTRAEEILLGTSDENVDSDNDGVEDTQDLWPTQSEYAFDEDLDGLPDNYEASYIFLRSYDPYDAQEDFDFDELTNLEEFIAGTNPEVTDSDLDGSVDGYDPAPLDPRYSRDDDRDGMPNEWELAYGLSPYRLTNAPGAPDSGEGDVDNDGLNNLQEFLLGTSPIEPDTDHDNFLDGVDHYPLNPRYMQDSDRDGMPDSYEWNFNLSPHDLYDGAGDPDGDMLNNSQEFIAGTNPQNPDSDFDGVRDGEDLWPTDRTKALDSDNDGLSDAYEVIHGMEPFFEDDGLADIDGDGLTLAQEIQLGTSDYSLDSDQDGLSEANANDVPYADPWPVQSNYSYDNDQDGLPDSYEEQYFFLYSNDSLDAQQDFDNDGLSNLDEFLAGTNPEVTDSDLDGTYDGEDPAPLNPRYTRDDDRDGLPNEWEIEHGLNPNFPQDAWDDIDTDELNNLQEFLLGTSPLEPDTDLDGLNDGADHFPFNPRHMQDSDRDGMPDSYEWNYGLSANNLYDGADDPDGDMLSNSQEFIAGTNPQNSDSDFDGVIDGEDLWPTDRTKALDSDNDGLSDAYEVIHGLDPYNAMDGDFDFDGDQLSLSQEVALGTSDENPDSDGDGVFDGEDMWPTNSAYSIDTDQDGLPDSYEAQYPIFDQFNALDASLDFDDDELSNLEEFVAGTDPENPDTDSDGSFDGQDPAPLDPQYSVDQDKDGLPDEWEMANGLNPNFSFDAWEDLDGDQLTNSQEFLLGTLIDNPDTDGDGFDDGLDHYPFNANYSFDMDRDSLPVEWEMQYGFSDNDTFDAISDIDGDGLTNLQEFQQGSDPTVAVAPFEFTMADNIAGFGAMGDFTYDPVNEAYTVNAGGVNIGGWVDRFYFVYQEVSGDIDISLRVATIEHGWSKGGLMIRDSLDYGSTYAGLFSVPEQSTTFDTRYDYYTRSAHTDVSEVTENIWYRLQKVGSTVNSYISYDGENWELAGTETLTLSEVFYVGFGAVTAECDPTTEFVFDNLSVIQ